MDQEPPKVIKKNGFINTFISVCSGTEGFPELIKQPFWRTYGHLLILTIICGLINVAFRLHPFNKSFEECCANLSLRFGKIEYTSQGVVPSLKPEEARSATSMDDFRVDYLPKTEDLKTYRPDKEFFHGIVWTPKSVLFWIKYYEGDDWSIFPFILPTKDLKSATEMLELFKSANQQADASPPFYTVSQMYHINPIENEGEPAIDFRDFKTNLLMWIPMSLPSLYSLFLFAYILLNMLVISTLYILFFTTFSYWFGRANILKLKFLELFSTGIYTGFPGFIIATLFVALGLPVLDFQSVFLISYFIYSFAVFSRLRRTFLPHPPPPKSDADKYEF